LLPDGRIARIESLRWTVAAGSCTMKSLRGPL
jgi:hypothetical protein